MVRFLIERDLPGAGKLTADDLRGIAARSNATIERLGPGIRWVESFVTDDRITCIYEAASEDIIREHAARGGFPATKIYEVRAKIDPSTAVTT